MPGEKRHWRLPPPFRSSFGKQDPLQKSNVGRTRRRVSSVYLSDDTSTTGFIVVPEFDVAVQTQTADEGSNCASYLPRPPVVTSCDPWSPNAVDSFLYDVESTGFRYSSRGGGVCNASIPLSGDDDLSRRLGSAYEHIRSIMMPATVSPKLTLSSDPQMLRKQLGVPQHSVLNYPIHSSPDLPNPHTLTPESSPELPPAVVPDVSAARKSKRLDLSINTNAYPVSLDPGSPDPFQPAQKESVMTVQIPEEICFSPPVTPDAHLTARIACTPRPRTSVSKPPKPTKRRVEEPIVSSSQQSTHRHAFKRVLRKQARHTPSQTNAHEWQISLPQVRPPSPFNVDIPLHHTWHDRQTDLFSSSEYYSRTAQFLDTKSRRTSGNTEVLASLAWIGTPPMNLSSCTANQTALFPDRFSIAIAVEDDSISDDALVNRLEEVRRIHDPSEPGRDRSSPLSPGSDYLFSVTTQDTTSDSNDAEVWQAARKALLCIREIIRTEKKYQEAIKMLLNAQTATPPPPPMVSYISALVHVSETLLRRFLEDPSAWGVSTAFVASEDELEATMVSWCAVAGVLFVDGNDAQSSGLMGRWRQRKSGVVSSPSPPMMNQSLNPLLPNMFPVASSALKVSQQVDGECTGGPWQHPPVAQERQTATISPQEPEHRNSQTLSGQPPSRKLSVRDLAIQPVQRVMRYVLLYRDLLDCTPPTSPSRLLVERALEAAARIANHCDSAQRNPAFSYAS